MKYIVEYQDELQISIEKIRKKIELSKNKKLNPYTISHQILDLILSIGTGNNDNDNDNDKLIYISDRIRKFHDFYGWMAKGKSINLGVCSGTFFRSKDYLSIPPKDRSGKKIDKHSNFGVHVEHSIPIKVLRNILVKNINANSKPEDVFTYLITYSICTGFSRVNERNGINYGFGSMHPDFNENGTPPRTEAVKPFIRYSNDVEIYSMLTGKKIEPTETLKNLTAETKKFDIFKWNFIQHHYI